MPAFPTEPDALTNEWLSETLGFPVASFKVQRLGEGAGLLGLVTQVLLEYEAGTSSDAPKSVIAKFPTPVAENRVVAETVAWITRILGTDMSQAAT